MAKYTVIQQGTPSTQTLPTNGRIILTPALEQEVGKVTVRGGRQQDANAHRTATQQYGTNVRVIEDVDPSTW